jgi:hypothetical protein
MKDSCLFPGEYCGQASRNFPYTRALCKHSCENEPDAELQERTGTRHENSMTIARFRNLYSSLVYPPPRDHERRITDLDSPRVEIRSPSKGCSYERCNRIRGFGTQVGVRKERLFVASFCEWNAQPCTFNSLFKVQRFTQRGGRNAPRIRGFPGKTGHGGALYIDERIGLVFVLWGLSFMVKGGFFRKQPGLCMQPEPTASRIT